MRGRRTRRRQLLQPEPLQLLARQPAALLRCGPCVHDAARADVYCDSSNDSAEVCAEAPRPQANLPCWSDWNSCSEKSSSTSCSHKLCRAAVRNSCNLARLCGALRR